MISNGKNPVKQKHTPVFEEYAHNPHQVLGPKINGDQLEITVFSPHTLSVELESDKHPMQRIESSDYFYWQGECSEISQHYRLNVVYDNKATYSFIDPYSFSQCIPEFDLHIHAQGNHWHSYEFLGANEKLIDNVHGILFAVWAPNAKRVSVVGSFNAWDGRRHPMQNQQGVWELFIPGIDQGELYKFEIVDQHGQLKLKTDPYGKHFELRPDTSAIVQKTSQYQWQDSNWLEKRKNAENQHQPFSIYEVHLGSWKRDNNHYFLNYRDLAHDIVSYVKELGFTHIELLPITEHPLDASWGYQTLGYYAPTSRFGSPDDFRYFVDYCHQNNIGVILDWVPAHFPMDDHGLARFDGTALYEHEDPRKGEHRDWGTYIFNYGRNEVNNFLVANALYWIEEFHIDGLRVDAVASMLYLDYSREPNDWIPNEYGGNENLEAIKFIQHLNSVTTEQFPGTVMIAEESTAWPNVTRPTSENGLGFHMKWNMGWMHDTLEYFQYDAIHRSHHHDKLTFGLMYAFTENFVLPFSHDEVVHGKGSLINKMSGDEWQRFANLKALYTFMFTYPGKKLLFMGNEFAQTSEWNQDVGLPWHLLDHNRHKGVQALIRDLNHLYASKSPLHYHDFEGEGFQWIDCEDNSQSIISYLRKHHGKNVIVILNFTPVPRKNYVIGCPHDGQFKEIFNSDSSYYSGENIGNHGIIYANPTPRSHFPYSLSVTIPPLAGLILEHCEQD
ncbi:MAG TPA: 1,4-alpha-glucan branching protein GlgB [Gammaproteobacteria bacterium]|nr:1,4-alpha-glucan branching protein GlgB [Gammaproteobacteria bacterium]